MEGEERGHEIGKGGGRTDRQTDRWMAGRGGVTVGRGPEGGRVWLCLSPSVTWIMAPRRMETRPVIFCLKSVLLLYTFIFWVSDANNNVPFLLHVTFLF